MRNFITYLLLDICHMHELHNCKDFVKFTDEVMVGHLRNTALVLRAQRSSRHMNFRMGGLMFDSKFNSKQSSTRDLSKEILHLFKHLSSEKGFY